MKYYLKAFKNYANATGRARRSEYWYFVLFNTLALILLMILFNFLDTVLGSENYTGSLIIGAFLLATLIPGLAVAVRRLHDIGKSGTWIFIYFVPLIGGIWLLVLLLTDSEPGANKYGLNPKDTNHMDDIDTIGSHLNQDRM